MLEPFCRIGIAVLAMLIMLGCPVSAFADEVIIEEGSTSNKVSAGDYSCSPCLSNIAAAAFQMKHGNSHGTVELTAGELWQFFNDQGYDSVSTMTLFLDVDQLSSDQNFNLSKLNVQIQSPEGGNLLTDANLGSNKLIVPGYETSANRPEAELRFDLGYDFMELFSPNSPEIVRVSIDAPMSGSMAPTFHLSADDTVLGQTNLGQMFLFVLFWGVVFLTLLRWMKPVREQSVPRTVSLPGSSRAGAATVRQRTA